MGNDGSSGILPKCSTTLDKMEIPRVNTIHEFKSVHQEINERIEFCQQKVGCIIKKQCLKADVRDCKQQEIFQVTQTIWFQ